MTEDEIVGWHHRLNEHEFEQNQGGDLRELPGVPLRGEGSCGGGGAPRDSAGSGGNFSAGQSSACCKITEGIHRPHNLWENDQIF